MQKAFYSFVFLFLLASASYASISDNMGTEDAAFLKIDPSSRPVAMGGAFVGLANDVNSVFWNPAGLTQVEKKELIAMYNDWIAGIKYSSGAYSQLLGKNAAIGVSIQGLWSEIERRTSDTEERDNTFGVHSYAAGLSGSYALIPKLFSLGATMKVISQDFDIDSSSGVAADFGGLIYAAGLRLGASVQNIKLQMSNDNDLPLALRFGGSYQMAKDAVIAAEYTKLGASDPSYNFGLEKWLRGILALRVGYSIGAGDNPREGLSAGIGLKAYGTKPLEDMNFQIDLAYVPGPQWGGLGDTWRISMLVRF